MRKLKNDSDLLKAIDDTIKISKKKNNGILKFLVSTDLKGNIVKYSLTYINTNIYNKDNGRVLGYGNDHGYHHKHLMGIEEKIKFTSFEEIQNRFETEWRDIHEKYQK